MVTFKDVKPRIVAWMEQNLAQTNNIKANLEALFFEIFKILKMSNKSSIKYLYMT